MAVSLGNHRFIAEISSLPKLFSWVKEQLTLLGIPCAPDLIQKIELSLEEVFVNITNYAYPDSQESSFIEISIELTSDKMLEITVLDWGIPYNPIESHVKKLRHEKNAVCPVALGGHGTKLILQLSQFAKYERLGNSNRLTLVYPFLAASSSALS